VYTFAVLCTKLVILLLYCRVFVAFEEEAFDGAICKLMGVLILFYVAIMLAKVWLWTPRTRIRDMSTPETYIDAFVLLDTSGLFNILMDVMSSPIPIKAIWSPNWHHLEEMYVSCNIATQESQTKNQHSIHFRFIDWRLQESVSHLHVESSSLRFHICLGLSALLSALL